MSVVHISRTAGPPGSFAEPPVLSPAEHARQARASMQEVLDSEASPVGAFTVDFIRLLRFDGWTLLKTGRGDGSTFRDVREFCEARRPHGLQTTWKAMRPFFLTALEEYNRERARKGEPPLDPERVAAMAEAPASKQGAHYSAEAKGFAASPIPPDSGGIGRGPGHTQLEQLRAVKRAPEKVVELVQADLLAKDVAAKLGPKDPTPEQAARAVEVANIATATAKAAPPGEPRARTKQRVTAAVREALGQDPRLAAFLRVLKAAKGLPLDDQKALVRELQASWEERR